MHKITDENSKRMRRLKKEVPNQEMSFCVLDDLLIESYY